MGALYAVLLLAGGPPSGVTPERADRLLIRPASGRQAGTGLSTRTYLAKDIRKRSHVRNESRAKSTGHHLGKRPRRDPNRLTVFANTLSGWAPHTPLKEG